MKGVLFSALYLALSSHADVLFVRDFMLDNKDQAHVGHQNEIHQNLGKPFLASKDGEKLKRHLQDAKSDKFVFYWFVENHALTLINIRYLDDSAVEVLGDGSLPVVYKGYDGKITISEGKLLYINNVMGNPSVYEKEIDYHFEEGRIVLQKTYENHVVRKEITDKSHSVNSEGQP